MLCVVQRYTQVKSVTQREIFHGVGLGRSLTVLVAWQVNENVKSDNAESDFMHRQ